MKRTMVAAYVLAMMSSGVWAQSSSQQTPPTKKLTATKQPSKKSKTSLQKDKPGTPAQSLPPQAMPPIPATLMNSAPVKPTVTMESGMLTIDAPNSTLSDVLNGIRKVTGASIEGASPTERVAVRLGPGHPEQVIAALLHGTPYDYVILGSLGKNDVVTRVLLTQSASGAEAAQASSTPMRAPESAEQQVPPEDGLPDRTPPDDATTNGEVEPDQAQQQQQQQPQQPAQQQPDANQPKTPEQLFKELQQLEQQKQQPQPR